MQYQQLQKHLNKPTTLWTVADIQVWLKCLNMQVLYPRFKKFAIDGSCLQQLQEEDLRNQLGIKSSITINKIMKWVKHDFKAYNHYLQKQHYPEELIPTSSFQFLAATHPKKKKNLCQNQSLTLKRDVMTDPQDTISDFSGMKRYSSEDLVEEKCVICYEESRNCMLLDCRHYVLCLRCSKGMIQCPICRRDITEIQRVYFGD